MHHVRAYSAGRSEHGTECGFFFFTYERPAAVFHEEEENICRLDGEFAETGGWAETFDAALLASELSRSGGWNERQLVLVHARNSIDHCFSCSRRCAVSIPRSVEINGAACFLSTW